jgi:hypothetical protein
MRQQHEIEDGDAAEIGRGHLPPEVDLACPLGLA